MTKTNFCFQLAITAFLACGCGSTQVGKSDNGKKPAPGSRITRLRESEDVLRQINRPSFVFKHSGAEITFEVTIFYKAGLDGNPQEIYRANGDHMVLGRINSKQPIKANKYKGFLIVAEPSSNGGRLLGRSVMTFTGPRHSMEAPPWTKEMVPSDLLASKKVSETATSGRGSPVPWPKLEGQLPKLETLKDEATLAPGRSALLLEHSEYFYSGPAETATRHCFLTHVTVHCVEGDKLPSRFRKAKGN